MIGKTIATSGNTTPLLAKRLSKKSPLQTKSVIKANDEATNAPLK